MTATPAVAVALVFLSVGLLCEHSAAAVSTGSFSISLSSLTKNGSAYSSREQGSWIVAVRGSLNATARGKMRLPLRNLRAPLGNASAYLPLCGNGRIDTRANYQAYFASRPNAWMSIRVDDNTTIDARVYPMEQEACDDGNRLDGDGCSSDCMEMDAWTPPCELAMLSKNFSAVPTRTVTQLVSAPPFLTSTAYTSQAPYVDFSELNETVHFFEFVNSTHLLLITSGGFYAMNTMAGATAVRSSAASGDERVGIVLSITLRMNMSGFGSALLANGGALLFVHNGETGEVGTVKAPLWNAWTVVVNASSRGLNAFDAPGTVQAAVSTVGRSRLTFGEQGAGCSDGYIWLVVMSVPQAYYGDNESASAMRTNISVVQVMPTWRGSTNPSNDNNVRVSAQVVFDAADVPDWKRMTPIRVSVSTLIQSVANAATEYIIDPMTGMAVDVKNSGGTAGSTLGAMTSLSYINYDASGNGELPLGSDESRPVLAGGGSLNIIVQFSTSNSLVLGIRKGRIVWNTFLSAATSAPTMSLFKLIFAMFLNRRSVSRTNTAAKAGWTLETRNRAMAVPVGLNPMAPTQMFSKWFVVASEIGTAPLLWSPSLRTQARTRGIGAQRMTTPLLSAIERDSDCGDRQGCALDAPVCYNVLATGANAPPPPSALREDGRPKTFYDVLVEAGEDSRVKEMQALALNASWVQTDAVLTLTNENADESLTRLRLRPGDRVLETLHFVFEEKVESMCRASTPTTERRGATDADAVIAVHPRTGALWIADGNKILEVSRSGTRNVVDGRGRCTPSLERACQPGQWADAWGGNCTACVFPRDIARASCRFRVPPASPTSKRITEARHNAQKRNLLQVSGGDNSSSVEARLQWSMAADEGAVLPDRWWLAPVQGIVGYIAGASDAGVVMECLPDTICQVVLADGDDVNGAIRALEIAQSEAVYASDDGLAWHFADAPQVVYFIGSSTADQLVLPPPLFVQDGTTGTEFATSAAASSTAGAASSSTTTANAPSSSTTTRTIAATTTTSMPRSSGTITMAAATTATMRAVGSTTATTTMTTTRLSTALSSAIPSSAPPYIATSPAPTAAPSSDSKEDGTLLPVPLYAIIGGAVGLVAAVSAGGYLCLAHSAKSHVYTKLT